MANKRFTRDLQRAHLQHPRPPMAHPVQRLHRLPLPPPLRQRGGHHLQWVLSAIQPEHRRQCLSQQLPDLGAAAVGNDQRGLGGRGIGTATDGGA